jgi:RNA polymerase sigma factor (sigma-70 family)
MIAPLKGELSSDDLLRIGSHVAGRYRGRELPPAIDADDLAQEARLAAWAAQAQWSPGGGRTLGNWCLVGAAYGAKRAIEKEYRHQHISMESPLCGATDDALTWADVLVAPGGSAADAVSESDSERHIRARLARADLTPKQREVVDLMLKGLNMQQVARRLGLTRQHVYARLVKVRTRLRRCSAV